MARVISMVDDIDHANGKATPADGTWRLTWDGSTVELDLTAEHRKEIDQLVAHLFRIGTIVGKSAATRQDNQGRRAYLRGLRAWADAQGRSDEYRTPSGGYFYPKGLREEYDEHQAG